MVELYTPHSKIWTEGIEVCTAAEYANMTFDKYTNTQRVIDNLANSITNQSPMFGFIGAAEFSINSPNKGHVRCPGTRKLVKALKKRHEKGDTRCRLVWYKGN